jgi:hypothetical protein
MDLASVWRGIDSLFSENIQAACCVLLNRAGKGLGFSVSVEAKTALEGCIEVRQIICIAFGLTVWVKGERLQYG